MHIVQAKTLVDSRLPEAQGVMKPVPVVLNPLAGVPAKKDSVLVADGSIDAKHVGIVIVLFRVRRLPVVAAVGVTGLIGCVVITGNLGSNSVKPVGRDDVAGERCAAEEPAGRRNGGSRIVNLVLRA